MTGTWRAGPSGKKNRGPGSENKLLKPLGLTKPSTQTGRSTLHRAKGVPKVLPAQGKVLPEGLAGLCRQDTPGSAEAAFWGFRVISQAFKMPKGKASRRTLRVTSLFFGSVKRNREKVIDFTHSALRVRVPSTVERRGDGGREEEGDVWNCRSDTWEAICLSSPAAR